MANLGGFLMSCLYGLTGLQLSSAEPAVWLTRPVVLPHGWDAIEVEQLFVRGRPARLLAPLRVARVTLAMVRLRFGPSASSRHEGAAQEPWLPQTSVLAPCVDLRPL